jgi:hypothetical protein
LRVSGFTVNRFLGIFLANIKTINYATK